jgi:hypothetical protein
MTVTFKDVAMNQILQCLESTRGKITAPIAVVACLYRDEFQLYGTPCLLILVTRTMVHSIEFLACA